MANKKLSFTDLPVSTLNEHLLRTEQIEIRARKAKLIPIYKLGDEMALTSVFLSAFRLIKEFRKIISSDINLTTSTKVIVFTEIEFIEDKKRIDGLICIERAGKIVDSALLEMKNEKNNLEKNQIEDYLEIAEKYGIKKLITVSNQFVSHPTQSPLSISKKTKIEQFHLSWTYILTVAHILLIDNDTNIEDQDQVEIMNEVVDYFEHPKSGVRGFTEMKMGWKNTSERVIKDETLKRNDPDVLEAVESWLQEEKDMALQLSRELGLLVGSGNAKFKDDYHGRIEHETQALVEQHYLESILKVNGAASNIAVRAKFLRRTIEFSTSLTAPQDKPTIRGQLGWIKKQIQKMQTKSPEVFEKIKDNIIITLKIKNMSGEERKSFFELDDFALHNKDRYLKEYGIVLNCDMGRNFSSRTNSIKKIEELLINYYQGVVQHLVKWRKPVPEIKNRETITPIE